MRVNLVILGFFFLLLSSCKKNEESIQYEIKGKITDASTGLPVAGASISLYKKEVSSGTFTNSFSLIETVTGDSDGTYQFVTDYGSIDAFKIKVEAANYFGYEENINPDDLSTTVINELNYGIWAKGFINFQIKNTSPFDTNDKIIFNSLNSDCQNCVKFNALTLIGMNIDTSFAGVTVANNYYKYQYITTKYGTTTTFFDSIFCIVGDTTHKLISF